MEYVDVILGHNIEYTGQCQGCPFWCQCSNRSHLEGVMPNRTEFWLFEGGKVDEIA